jgi:hypothetical protein
MELGDRRKGKENNSIHNLGSITSLKVENIRIYIGSF